MKRITLPSLAVVIILLVSSCDGSFLSQKPQISYTDSTVWNSIRLVKAFVNQLYRDDLPMLEGGNGRSLLNMSDLSGDSFIRFNYANAILVQTGQVSPSNTTGFASIGIWNNFWDVIRRCNVFLHKINTVPGDADLKNRLTGQVHFLRAWAYFALIKRYGGVPIIKKFLKLVMKALRKAVIVIMSVLSLL